MFRVPKCTYRIPFIAFLQVFFAASFLLKTLVFGKRFQDIQPHVAAFFGVELTTEDVVFLHARRHGHAVGTRRRHALFAIGSEIGMHEIHVVAVFNILENGAVLFYIQRVPPDVRYLFALRVVAEIFYLPFQ